jgi:glutathione S-transferase
MSLTLHYHPLASFCWKPLIALYEADIPFERVVVDLGDPAQRARLEQLWPPAKFPVLEDRARGQVAPESTIVIEYLVQHYESVRALIPADPDRARAARLWDRFYDGYVHVHMQKIVLDRLRPAEQRDAYGVDEARAALDKAYAMLNEELARKEWAAGETFTLADCSAFPALFYANMQQTLRAEHGHVAAYLTRLLARPSIARVLREAEPYMHNVPK